LRCGISARLMTLRVSTSLLTVSAARPLFHRKRKSTRDLAMSHKCHKRTRRDVSRKADIWERRDESLKLKSPPYRGLHRGWRGRRMGLLPSSKLLCDALHRETALDRRTLMAVTIAGIATPTTLGAKECPTMDWITMSLEARNLAYNNVEHV